MSTVKLTANEDAEATALAAHFKLTTNSSLSVEELKGLGLARLKELKAMVKPAAAQAVPYDLNTLTGPTGTKPVQANDALIPYDLNTMEAK